MPDMHRLPHDTPIGWLSGENPTVDGGVKTETLASIIAALQFILSHKPPTSWTLLFFVPVLYPIDLSESHLNLQVHSEYKTDDCLNLFQYSLFKKVVDVSQTSSYSATKCIHIKFNLEANAVIKLSFKLSSFDSVVDITDDAEIHTLLNYLRPVLMNDAADLKGSIQGNNSWHRAIALAVEKEFPLGPFLAVCLSSSYDEPRI
ncbi:hypothetical protein Tco_1456358 [Tanacetum coccineum]